MTRFLLSLIPFTFTIILAETTRSTHRSTTIFNRSCRYIPEDVEWPNANEWASLNRTVHGRLAATVPVGNTCHQTNPLAIFNQTACALLQTAVETAGPATLDPVPGEILNPYWQNFSCSPFTAPSIPCELGNRAAYSIKVSDHSDVQAGLAFVLRHNIRLVVRNTGIDYAGRSTGHGALALYMYGLKSTKVLHNYEGISYSGPALRLGAGVTAGEANQAIQGTGYRFVTAECGLTGTVGGYVQSGGQSQLVTAYGLAADQVLEWELVTPRGEYLIASPANNTDLYWALAGGGGGTYGIVLSATFRVFPEGPVAGGSMVVRSSNSGGSNSSHESSAKLFEAITLFFRLSPTFVDHTRDNIQFFITNDTLTILNFVMPDQYASSVFRLLESSSFLPDIKRLGLDYELTTQNYSSYLESFIASYGPLPLGTLCPSFPLIGSRLIPRSAILSQGSLDRLVGLYRNITRTGTWWVGCSILNVDDEESPSHSHSRIRPPHPPNSVNPAWRRAIAYCNPQTHTPYPFRQPRIAAELRRELVEDILPRLEDATPGGGWLDETDPTYNYGDWKEGFYGKENYDRLLQIKHAYDPHGIMYGFRAVGSDEFEFDGNGRLCIVTQKGTAGRGRQGFALL